MRYKVDENNYITDVYFNCYAGTCSEYTGNIPDGYTSLEEWASNANILAYKIVDNNLVYDSVRDAELQEQWKQELQENMPGKYELPTASATTLGGVKVGAGLAINEGVLSATGGGVADSIEWANVQNKPTKVSDFTNDVGYITESAADTKYSTQEEIEVLGTVVKNQTNLIHSQLAELSTPIRKLLFNDSSNTSSTIELTDSVYNYSYLYVESSAATYNVMIPIYSASQSAFRGIGGFSGDANVGSTHAQGTISNEGKTMTFTYLKSIVHTNSNNHSASTDRAVCKVIGVR